jgi:flagellar biosynthesis protein FlhB
VILSCGFSSPQIIFGIAYLSCQMLIQFGVYGLDELIPDVWWYQNIISPLFLIGASALLMFAMMTLMPTLMVSQMWWLMLPIGMSCLVKFVIQIISTKNRYDMDNKQSSAKPFLFAILPILITMIGISLATALYAQAFQLLVPHFIMALMGYCVATQVVIYALDVIPNDNIRVCLQIAATICMSAGLVFGMMAWLPTVPIWTVVTTVASSALVRVSTSQKQLRDDYQLLNENNKIDQKQDFKNFDEVGREQCKSPVYKSANSGGGEAQPAM